MADPFPFSPVESDFNSPPRPPSNPHESVEQLELERNSLKKVLRFLSEKGFREASAAIQRVAVLVDGHHANADENKPESAQEAKIDAAVTSYQSLSEPERYALEYRNFLQLLGMCLDDKKAEMSLLLYPVFVHMYLELICNSHGAIASKFFAEFSSVQETFYGDDLVQLKCLKDSSQLKSNVWFCTFHSSSYVIRMSTESVQKLKEFFSHNSVFEKIINSHIHIEHFDGVPRAKATTEAYSGGILGEATKIANKSKVFYGLLKESTSAAQPVVEEEPDGEGTSGKKSKKKLKEAGVTKRMKAEQSHGPPVGRIPLPDLSESVKQDRIKAAKEIAKRVKIGPDRLPSICFYSVLNARNGVCCAEITEDTSQMALGNGNSTIQVWSVDPQKKLRRLKPTEKLERLDKEADDVMEQALDSESSTESLTLVGHSGPVYGLSYGPDKSLLLSASEDATVRLWSLLTWSNLVAYKTPGFPLWDCNFSPYGHYFVTGGADRTALLWCCDRLTPIRVFAGHFSDVTRVLFHPNSNYVATGSCDRTVRLWDLANGQCVRYFTGHKSMVHSMQFSPDGRTLATGGADGRVLLWDVGMGIMSADIQAHQGRVYSLNYSRDGTVLASGGSDYYVKLHYLQQLLLDSEPSDGVNHNPKSNCGANEQLLAEFPTKATSPLQLHFTRKNLLIAVGAYGQ